MPEATKVNGEMVEVLVCDDCGRLDPGPREVCMGCHGRQLSHCSVPSEGTLLSWTVIRRPPTRFQDDAPYAVAVVELDAGVRVTGRLAQPHNDLEPGVRVYCVTGDRGYPLFKEALYD